MYNLKHLHKKEPIFSIQNDEALFLYSLTKLLAPKIVVEFGFLTGYSTKNFLAALPKDGFLYSYDPSIDSAKIAKRIKTKNFKFFNKLGQKFSPQDVNNQSVDLVFLDASHELTTNIEIFANIYPSLSPQAIILVHDTGLYNEDLKTSPWITPTGYLIGRGYVHQPDERRFINHLKSAFPNLQQLNLHSLRVGRLGITMLQNYQTLDL